MKKGGLPMVAWILAGLLAIASCLISLGQQDTSSQPEVASYAPSGVSAFAELLRRRGIAVEINRESKPKLENGDVAIAFRILKDRDAQLFGADTATDPFMENFWSFIKAGGTGLVLPLKGDYLTASRSTVAEPFASVSDLTTKQTFKVTTSGISGDDGFTDPSDDSVEMELWRQGNEPFVKAYRLGKGTALELRDGMGATNRFIDKNDNAKALVSLVSMLNRSGKKVVFTEASFGNVQDPGLLETVGAWANAAWQQLLFLGVVIVFTLGKRFGIAEDRRPTQRGSRELLDAISDSFRRARSTQAALKTCSDAADSDLRRVLKLPKDASRAERDRLIPVNLQNALARLDAASQYPAVTQDQALDLIVRAQDELEAFIGPYRAKLRSLAKLKA